MSARAPTIPHRLDVIRSHRQGGGQVAAVLPIHYPRALLRAFNILPVEVWGPPNVDVTRGAEHLQPYVCSIVRNALSFLLSGGLDVADLILVPHTCDSLQGLGSILIDLVRPRQPVLTIYLPRGHRASDLQFLADEIHSLYKTLSDIVGVNPSNAELLTHIAVEEQADDLLSALHRERKNLPGTQSEFYQLVRSREYLPAEMFVSLAESAIAQKGPTPKNDGIPILISGIVPEPMGIFQAVSQMNGVVVADDLACCGRRLYPHGTSTDPFVRLAERIVNAPPDSTRGSTVDERLEHLIRLTRESGARGIVFYDVKFCEPELFYLPALRKALQERNIPSVVIEVDLNDPLSQQVLTRLEAFLEMLG